MSDAVLAAVLDCLLPGGDGFPRASELDLAGWLGGRPEARPAVAAMRDALADGGAALSAADLTERLRAIEAGHPADFEAFLVAAYAGYYTHPRVLAVIAAATGYAGRPPQPGGHALPPFDPALLDTMRRRPRSYREA